MAESVTIEDAPAFPYRGVLIDTSRHFIEMETIKTMVRAAADGTAVQRIGGI
jgi:N-acetyl-beta-hexosaminidase